MGIFSPEEAKQTQPWDKQYGLWTLLSMFMPQFGEGFQSAKPNMFNQVFGKGTDTGDIADNPLSQIFKSYDPQNFLKSLGRDATAPEQALLDKSLFGVGVQPDLSGATAATGGLQDLMKQLNPGEGGGFGANFQNLLQGVGGPAGANMPQVTPQLPQATPRLNAATGMTPPTPGAAAFGVGQGPQSLQFSGGGGYGGGGGGGAQNILQTLMKSLGGFNQPYPYRFQ
jgi:hypothetical protein